MENYCLCCSSPLATKGRANLTQLIRRAERKNVRKSTTDKVVLKDAATTIIANYNLLDKAELIMAKNAATKKIGDST